MHGLQSGRQTAKEQPWQFQVFDTLFLLALVGEQTLGK